MPKVLPKGAQYDGLITNFDFYSTIASVIGQPVPKHCDDSKPKGEDLNKALDLKPGSYTFEILHTEKGAIPVAFTAP